MFPFLLFILCIFQMTSVGRMFIFILFVYLFFFLGGIRVKLRGLQFLQDISERIVGHQHKHGKWVLFVFYGFYFFIFHFSFGCERMLRTSSNPICRVKGLTLCEVDWDQNSKYKGNFIRCSDTLVQSFKRW